MRNQLVTAIIIALALAACSRDDTPSYQPPIFDETAYVLAASDHIAVLNLKSNKLERIKLNREGADLAILGNRLYVLATDGNLAAIEGLKAGPWSRVTDHGLALAAMDHKYLLVLGRKEIVVFEPGAGVKKRIALDKEATSISYDPEKKVIWCVDRAKSNAFSLSAADFQPIKELASIANSPHHALAFPQTNELWVAEGNELMNGKPHGVGFVPNGVAASGGINVVDTANGKITDFIMVGGNVTDLALSADRKKLYVATSQYNEFLEATMSVVDPAARRPRAEFRLCLYCHEDNNVEPKGGRAMVRAMAVIETKTGSGEK